MNEQIKNICKIGQGNDCCRYLMMGSGGWECAKGTSLQRTLDIRAEFGKMTARGDNCEGKTFKELNSK